ncbi:class I SAM-dependent methyltransferase [Sphingosinicella soli]|uniref:23S rRNA (Cytosine1962-C5)-methyltransferase n=1 Tax=Sphingosinicella soli TaxID=333708 RepID=A0A7W7B3R7_9SPHN|nr:class I SAM-dependent methyltransferase [Sphingosinicella soli]MBB4633460.1 23S rRNA (cytosine1962-C5)-methyltransferase [Sphingosinicella soli]
MALATLVTEPWADFGLVDSGHGRKLERYGPWRFIRPEPQAMWVPAAPDWHADGEFIGGSDAEGGGRWTLSPKIPGAWPLARGPVKFWASNTPFRHLAFFPDMAPQWDWIADRVAPGDEVLNLFGYTGVASLVMAAKGARVTHVDASKKAIGAATENQKLSGLGAAPIRWLVDDALKFVEREVRRGRRYAGIILDPPKYGRGPKGEVWELDEKLAALMAACAALLDDRSKFLVLTAYAVRMSAIAIANLTEEVTRPLGGSVEAGEMTIREEARGLLLPTAIFARWSR